MTPRENEPNRIPDNFFERRLSRRALLVGTAAGGFGLVVAACGGSNSGASSSGTTPTGSSPAMSDVTLRNITYINWIGKDEYKNFKNATGITVKQVAANSSDDRLTKIQSDPDAGDFVLTDLGFAGRLDGLGLLATLDVAAVPNSKLIDEPFRVGPASVAEAKVMPTDFGRSGILYRQDKITDKLESWADFFALARKHSGKVSMLDFSDGTLPVAAIAAGYSTNTTDQSEISKAADLLINIKPHVLAFITGDEAKPLVDGSAWMGQVEDWAAGPALAQDSTLKWVDPTDGIHGYVEGWAALKASPHVEEVQRFLDFHLQPKVAANFANTLSIAPIERASLPFISASVKNSPVTNPGTDVLQRIEFKRFVGEAQKLWDDAWARFKAA